MKRLMAAVVGVVVALGGLAGFVSPARASVIWTFPAGSFVVDNGVDQATVSYSNLRIADGSTASGTVRVDSPLTPSQCSTQTFSGLSAELVPSGGPAPEACRGNVTFSVAGDGTLNASTAFTIKSYPFSGAVDLGKGTEWKLTCSAVLNGSAGADVTWVDPVTGATGSRRRHRRLTRRQAPRADQPPRQ